MSLPTVRSLPDAPQRTEEPNVFSDKADQFVAAMHPWGQDVNGVVTWINTTIDNSADIITAVTDAAATSSVNAGLASSSAIVAGSHATSAAASASSATSSASSAVTSRNVAAAAASSASASATAAAASAASALSSALQATSAAQSASASAESAESSALDAEQHAFESMSAANFAGLWSEQTGAATVPYSVYHNDSYWLLMVNLADVTASEPSESNPDWKPIKLFDLVRTPVALAPRNELMLAVSYLPELVGSAYQSIYSNDLRATREWQLDVFAGDFSDPHYEASENNNRHQMTLPLLLSTTYKWRCRDTALSGAISQWSRPAVFTTADTGVVAPTVTVSGGPSSVQASPTITTSAYEYVGVFRPHLTTSWIVRGVSDDEIVWQSLDNAVNKTSIKVPAGILVESTAYKFSAIHTNEVFMSSMPGSVTATTAAVFDIVPLLAYTKNLAPRLNIYKQSIDTFNLLEDAVDTQPLCCDNRGLAFSQNDVYLATSANVDPFIYIYKRTLGSLSLLPSPATLPTGAVRSVAFSDDNVYLAAAHAESPYITIYKRDGDTFTKLANPANLPTSNARAVAFSPDAAFMAVATNDAPYLIIYSRSGDTFTKLADPADMPTFVGQSVAFSNDSNYLAVGFSSDPRLIIYKRTGSAFTKLNTITGLSGLAAVNALQFSADDAYLAVGHGALRIFKRDGDNFTNAGITINHPGTLNGTVGALSFSADIDYLAVAHSGGSPFLRVYKRSNDTFTLLSSPVSPSGAGLGIAFSNTGFPQ